MMNDFPDKGTLIQQRREIDLYIAQQLKLAREVNGMTQTELGKLTGSW
jgi:DNA-binding XRE family transcriptional regulator